MVGERLAARHLARRGWRVLARNLVVHGTELDLVCHDGAELVCVEVKTGRHGPRFRPGHRVRRPQLERLWRAAEALGRRSGRRARVDLIEVLLDQRGQPREILHHRRLRAPLP